jgi:phospholipid transport system substrate-binding protein
MIIIRRRMIILFAVASLFPIYGSTAVAGDITDPTVLVQSVLDEVLALLRGDRGDDAGKRRRAIGYLEEKLSPHIDFKKMMQLAMGKNWRLASEAEKTKLAEQFQLLLINVYAGVFLLHKDKPVACLPSRYRAGDTTASIRVLYAGGTEEKISMVIFMEQTASGWQAYNIDIEGVSLVLAYQESFRTEVRAGGIAGLIGTLKRKNAGIK